MKQPKTARWRVLFVTTLASSLFLVDTMIVPIALPQIKQELGFSDIGGMWVINAYLLTLTAFLLIAGKLCEFYGIRRLYCIGMSLFGLGALVGSFAYTSDILLLSRVVMGMGSACAFPATASLLMRSFPVNLRASALGIDTGVATLFMMLSPPLVGFLTQFYSWRWIFVFYFPFVIAGIYLCRLLVDKERKKVKPFPFFSSGLMFIGVVSFVTGLMQGDKWGWSSSSVLMLLFGGIFFTTLFIRQSLREAYPLADFTLFKNPLFLGANISRFVAYVLMAATAMWVVYFQTVLNCSPVQIGIFMLLGSIPVIGMSPLGGILADRFWFRFPLSIGYCLLLFSFSWMICFHHTHNVLVYFPGLFAFGVGVAMIMSPTLALGLSTIRYHSMGSASGVMMAIRQLASSLGIAFMTATYYTCKDLYGSPEAGMLSICLFAFLLTLAGFLAILLSVKQKFYQRFVAQTA